MPTRFRGPSQEVSNFLACVLLHLLLPLLPVLIELLLREGVGTATLTLTAALYSMSIGLSSKNVAMFALCVLVGLIFATLFGSVALRDGPDTLVRVASIASIGVVFLIHALERFNRHVVDCAPFFEFYPRG